MVNFPICGQKTHLEIWEQLKNEKLRWHGSRFFMMKMPTSREEMSA